jgi:elongation factor 1-gamma
MRSRVVAKFAGASLDEQKAEFGKTNKSPEFLAKFPFGKLPAAETPEGSLYESNAISYYIAASKKPEMIGKSIYEQALVMQHICTIDCEIYPLYAKIFYPLFGYATYNSSEWKASVNELIAKMKVYDHMLLPRTFLAGESITIADLILATLLHSAFTMILDNDTRKNLVNLTRWFVTIANQAEFKAVMGETKLCDKIVNPEEFIKAHTAASVPAAATTAAAAAAAAHHDEEEEDEPKAKPEKNALDLLPPTKLNLEEWKRFYSNAAQTKPTATNWFWEHFDPSGYSIWRADYKYNEELKKIFMTCNLVTGLFHRMDAMRKYCFASVLIFGEDDKNEISGFFVFRGTDMPELMKDVPDFESYEWTKMDTSNPKQVELFNDYLAWEGDFGGKVVNQGKVFK